MSPDSALVGLSRRRPLSRGVVLPSLVLGLIVGEAASSWSWFGARAGAAVLLMAGPGLLLAHRRAGSLVLLLGLGVGLGHLRCVVAETGHAPEVRGWARVVGQVRDLRRGVWPSGDCWASLDIAILEVDEAGHGLEPGMGLSLSIGRAEREWQIGDFVSFGTRVRVPRGFCNQGRDHYRAWLLRRGIAATAYLSDDRRIEQPATFPISSAAVAIAALRGGVARAIDRAVEGDAGAVLRALVIGDRSGLSPILSEAYARTGTAHLLSVSGFHLALIAGAVFGVLRWLIAAWPWVALRVAASRVGALVALGPVAAYLFVTGCAIATIRSFVMAAVVLIGIGALRRSSPLILLSAAAGILCAMDVEALGDVSFQLSFASVAGILLGIGRLERSRWRIWVQPGAKAGTIRRLRAWVLGAAAVSAVAVLATAPLTAFHFGTVSLVAVPMNLLVAPLVGVGALASGLFGAILLPISSRLADLCFRLAGQQIELGDVLVEAVSAWPWAALSIARPNALETLAASSLVALVFVDLRKRLRLAVVVAAIGVLVLARSGRAGRLEVSFLDVGQGDAAILAMPFPGPRLLIDGGGLGGRFDTGSGVVLPALRTRGIRSLDGVMLSHADRDHYGGLAAVVRGVGVREFWWSARGASSPTFEDLSLALAESGVSHRALARGDRPLEAGSHGEIEILHPPRSERPLSRNDASLVLRARYGATAFLFTGDVEADAEEMLVGWEANLRATVVKVPHHGSRTSSSGGFLRSVRPSLGVAMIGLQNRFGFPAPEVVERYRAFGAAWLDTARAGEVSVESDGQLLDVITCRDVNAEVRPSFRR